MILLCLFYGSVFQLVFCYPIQNLMTMDTILPTLACYLLAISSAVAQTENGKLTTTTTITTSDLNLTHTTALVTPTDSTVHETVTNLTDNTSPSTSMTQHSATFTTTVATTESKSPLQTSQSTTIMTPLTDSTSLTSTTPGTHTPTFTAMTTPAMQTTGGYISTPDTTVITTANSSHTVNTTSVSPDGTTQGKHQASCFINNLTTHHTESWQLTVIDFYCFSFFLLIALRLSSSEKNMTIIFSAVLGMFAVALIGFMLHKCKHKIQYLHRPLNTDDTGKEFPFIIQSIQTFFCIICSKKIQYIFNFPQMHLWQRMTHS